jgi:hypothetical protein
MSGNVERQPLGDGSTRLSAGRCAFTFRKEVAGVLHITISGRDVGQFGSSVFDEIRLHLEGSAPLEMFVDATDADGPSAEVSDAWTKFLNKEAPRLKRVTILAVSKFVHLTVSVAKLFSRTGELIQVYSDPKLFRSALARSTSPSGGR